MEPLSYPALQPNPPVTNPLLDHIDDKVQEMHPLAQAALTRAIPMIRSQMGAPSAAEPGAAPPMLADAPANPIPLARPSTTPAIGQQQPSAQEVGAGPPKTADMPAPTPLARPSSVPMLGQGQPAQSAPSPLQTRLGAAQDEQERLRNTGSGLHQLHNPLLKTLGTIGDVIGTGFFPRAAMAIPGTTLHHNMLLNEAGNNVNALENQENEEQKRQTEAAQIPHIEAETGLTEAQTKEIQDRLPKDPFALWMKQNPGKSVTDYEKNVAAGKAPTSQFELWLKQNPNGTVADFEKAEASGKPASNAFELWQRENPSGTYRDFETQQQAITSKPLSKEHADALNASWSKIADKYHLPANQFHEGMTSAEASDLVKSFNDVVGKAQGGQNITIRQEAANTAATNTKDKESTAMYEKRRSEIEKDLSPVNTQLENIQEARDLVNGGSVAQALGKVKTLVGVAGGRGSGVRVTQAELNSELAHRGIARDFEGWVNSLEGKGNMTTEDIRQFNDVLGAIERTAQAKQERANGTLTKMNAATSVKELKDIDDEYRKGAQGGAAVDPKVKAYADQYFGGDVTKAQAAIADQQRGK